MLTLGLWDKPIEMLYNDAVMIMGLVYTTILFMAVPIIGVMEGLDDSYIEAAYDLGAKKITIWRKIIIPHCMPGIMSGSIMVFMLVLGSYLTPNLMGGKTHFGLHSRYITSLYCILTGTRVQHSDLCFCLCLQ